MPAKAAVDWFDPAYLEANTQDYGTGFITVPSPSVIPHGWLSASLHRYRVKVDYGLWNAFEIGLTSDVEGYTDLRNIGQKTLAYGRLRVLNQKKHGIHLSFGANGIGWEDLGLGIAGFVPDPAFEHTEIYYAVMGRTVPGLPSMIVTLGIGGRPEYTLDTGNGARQTVEAETWVFGNVSQVVIDGLLVMAEVDQSVINLGLRMLLSAEIKLDLTVYDAQSIRTSNPFADVLERNIRFGISYTEKWPG